MLVPVEQTPRSILLTICFSVSTLLLSFDKYMKVFLELGDKLLKWKHPFILIMQARYLLFSLFDTLVLLSRAIIMRNRRQPCLTAISSTIKTLDPGPSIGLNTRQFQYLEHQSVVALKVLAF